MELGISWCEGEFAYVSADFPKFRNLLTRLKTEHPDKVTLLAGNPDNENPALRENDGCLYAKVPLSWIRIKPPRAMTEEQKNAARERLINARLLRDQKKTDEFPEDVEELDLMDEED